MFRKTSICGLGAMLLVFLAACGGGSGSGDARSGNTEPLGDAPISTPGACEAASFPSLEWTLCETRNLFVSQENEVPDLALLPQVLAATAAYERDRRAALRADPERRPDPNLCTLLCPVDPRLNGWADDSGMVAPVLFTSRSGGTLSGHVWATRSGPAKRPGVVIINGSIVGYEQVYWYAAQALAKAGFVVLTFDAQGEGSSDQFGEAPDANEDAFAGIPVLGLLGPIPASGPGLGGNGLPFYDGGEDALNFFVSTPDDPYVPVASRKTGTSHAAKQQRRAAAGLNAAYNPYWEMLDASAIGLAGHSYGAIAASWLAQNDSRVTTAVAWDSLCVPVSPAPDELAAVGRAPVNTLAGLLRIPALYGLPSVCFAAPAGPAPPITKPALGLNGDYFAPVPYLAPPQPQDKARASLQYTAAGVDSGNLVIRGGTHLDYTDVPIGALPATLRGIDLVTWYTVAWFAKYLQHDPDADRMLLTARWRDDAAAGAADPSGDANLFSYHYQSRLDITLEDGQSFDCENLRDGCVGQYRAAVDCGPAAYSFVSVDTAPDAERQGTCSGP